jgi:YihY family inner membrane protein
MARDPGNGQATSALEGAPDAAPDATDEPDTTEEEARGGPLGAVDRFQQRYAYLAFPVGVVRKFGDDRAGRLAALISYYGFFSLFPLLLVATTIIGFVLDDKQAEELQESIVAEIPVVGSQVAGQANELSGSIPALVVGLVLALWAGLGCMQAAQDAMNEVWDVPRLVQPSFAAKRLRSLGSLIVFGSAILVSTFVTQLVSRLSDLPELARIGGAVLSFAVSVSLYLLLFRMLTTARPPWRRLLPGALLGALGFTVLQHLGSWYIERTITGAEDTYGTFAVVIGLLSWLYLLGQLSVFAAEVNVVAARRLWPRALFPPKLTEADRESLTAEVLAQQMRPEQEISVSYVASRDADDGEAPTPASE